MPVNLACSIGWLTREPQLTLHLRLEYRNLARNAESFSGQWPAMSFPRIPQWLLCTQPLLSVLSLFISKLDRTQVYMYVLYICIRTHHIYIYTRIPTLCSRVGSPRIAHAAYARSCVYSDVSPSCAPDCPHVEAKHSNVWEELWDCRTSGWVCRMRSRLRSYLVNFQPQTRLETCP